MRPREPARAFLRLRAALRQIPRAAWFCLLIACLNAACWSIINPPFQLPDEPSHFAYTQDLVQAKGLPTPSGSYSPEETAVLHDLHHLEVRWHPGSPHHFLGGRTAPAADRPRREPVARRRRGRGSCLPAAALLRAGDLALRTRLGRHPARPVGADAAAECADGGAHRALCLPVRARDAAVGPLVMDGGRSLRRAGAPAGLHVRRSGPTPTRC